MCLFIVKHTANLSLEHIEKTLPHRYPFLLVDKIIELSDKHIVGIKIFTFNEWFSGSLSQQPSNAGCVYRLKRTCTNRRSILCINAMGQEHMIPPILKIDNCKFKSNGKAG